MSASELIESVKEETAVMKVSRMAVGLCEQVQALTVKDQATYDSATDLYKALVAMEKEIDATHDPVISHWHEKHKAALAEKNKDAKPVGEAKKLVKSKAAQWQDEQERIRQEAERKSQEEARRIQAEQERIAREAQEAERKRLAAIEEEERLRLAAEAEATGATQEQVTEILETPLPIPEPEIYIPPVYVAPVIPPTFDKAQGFSVRWAYSGVGENIMELIKAAAVNPYLAGFLQFNETAINALARSQKDAFKMPGVRLEKKRV